MPAIRWLLAVTPGMAAAVIAERIGWTRGMTVLRDRVAEAVFDATQTNRLGGQAVRLPEGSVSRREVEVVSVGEERASVRDCAVDDAVVVDLDTGEVLDDDIVTRLAMGELVREDGAWRVSFTRVEQTWEGVAGCAVE